MPVLCPIPWRARLALPGVVVALVACTGDLELPAGARIGCQEGAACPQGFVCNQAGRCERTDALDRTPPALAAPATVVPSAGRAGTRFIVSFEVSEALSRPPEVTLDLGARQPPFELSTAEGLRCEYAYEATGGEPEGRRDVSILLADASGNEVRDTSAVLELDFTRPEVRDLRVEGGRDLRREATGTVVFELSEPAGEVPRVRLLSEDGEAPFDCTEVSQAPPTWRCSYTVREADREGEPGVAVTVADGVGNLTEVEHAALLHLDFTNPTFVGEPELINPDARAGMVLGVAFDVAEELAEVPAVSLRPRAGGDPVPLALGEQHAGSAGPPSRRIRAPSMA